MKIAGKVQSLIEQAGHEVWVIVPRSAADIGAALDRPGAPVERIVAVGGDGLVHAVVGQAVRR